MTALADLYAALSITPGDAVALAAIILQAATLTSFVVIDVVEKRRLPGLIVAAIKRKDLR